MFIKQKRLLSAEDYKNIVPLSKDLRKRKEQLDAEIIDNFATRKKLVVVCGPCSADKPTSMEEYLKKLRNTVQNCDKLLTVARIYTAKPHSKGTGYKGSAFQLSQTEEVDLNEGIIRCRHIMIRCLELGLPIADELLYPELYECFDDLVGYWFVGARSSEDSFHRDIASGLDVCCGVKNPTDGDVERAIDSLYAVTKPCIFPYNGLQIVTHGCKYAHLVLRGGYRDGKFALNIGVEQVASAKKMLRRYGLSDFVMADLNHANSGKIAVNQINNGKLAILSGVDGVMIESYLHPGAQSVEYGTSQTDDCLGFEMTEKLLYYLNDSFQK